MVHCIQAYTLSARLESMWPPVSGVWEVVLEVVPLLLLLLLLLLPLLLALLLALIATELYTSYTVH